jgi:hypothetical protein
MYINDTIQTHSTNNKYKYTYHQNNPQLSKHQHITKPTHTRTHTLQNKLQQPQYKLHTNHNLGTDEIMHFPSDSRKPLTSVTWSFRFDVNDRLPKKCPSSKSAKSMWGGKLLIAWAKQRDRCSLLSAARYINTNKTGYLSIKILRRVRVTTVAVGKL